MYKLRPTTKFQKDLKRIQKRGYDLSLLTEVLKNWQMGRLFQRRTEIIRLQETIQDAGNGHVAPDWLLIYEISHDELILYLTRTGTHSDLF